MEPGPIGEAPLRADDLAGLYRRDYVAMVRLAHLITGSNEAAEDVVQDSFVRLQRNWDRAEVPGAYLRTIVLNRCRSWQRRQIMERERQPRPAPAWVDPEADELLDALARLNPASAPPWSCASTWTCPRPTWPRLSGAARGRSSPSCTAASTDWKG